MGTLVGSGVFSAGDFVGQDKFEELGVSHAARVGEGEPFGECVETTSQLGLPQQRFGFRCHDRGDALLSLAATGVTGVLSTWLGLSGLVPMLIGYVTFVGAAWLALHLGWQRRRKAREPWEPTRPVRDN